MPLRKWLALRVVLSGLVAAGCSSGGGSATDEDRGAPSPTTRVEAEMGTTAAATLTPAELPAQPVGGAALANAEVPDTGDQEDDSNPEAGGSIDGADSIAGYGLAPDFEGQTKWLLCLKPEFEESLGGAWAARTLWMHECGDLPPLGGFPPFTPPPPDEGLPCPGNSAPFDSPFCYFDLPIDPG